MLVKILIQRCCESSSFKGPTHCENAFFNPLLNISKLAGGRYCFPLLTHFGARCPRMVKHFEAQGCSQPCCVCLRQPACFRAWQRSHILWPGPWPQVHLHIPGAGTLLPTFHRARATTRHQIKNKWQLVTHILFLRPMQTKIFCFCNHKILLFTKNSLHLL